MKLKHLATGAEILLPDDLQWVDEHAWTPVAQSASRLIDGALLVETAVKKKGRPITLRSPSEDMAWLPFSAVKTLHEWAEIEAAQFELTYRDGRTFTVIMAHDGQSSAVEAVPLKGFPARADDEPFGLTLRLMEV
ncbi:MAG: hypothetical protein LBE75_06490 [Burkholderiales bacterium]|jgi:hypothetical protein|nr:hypothetical protein [Burkholderiales bacterium]